MSPIERTTRTSLATGLLATALLFAGAPAAAAGAPVTAGGAAFYAAAGTIVAAFFLLNAALRNVIGLWYAALFAAMLALIWVLEGGLAVWTPEIGAAREWKVALTTAFAGTALGFVTAERAVAPDHPMRWFRRGARILALLSLLFAAVAWLAPPEWLAPAATILLLAMFAGHPVAMRTWRTLDGRPQRATMLFAGAFVLAVVGMLALSTLGGALADIVVLYRSLFSLAALSTMGAISLGLADMRRSREAALHAALDAARKDAEISASLLEMERNYTQARQVAVRRAREIATASHDMRQPVAALRAELDGLRDLIGVSDTARLDRILDHFNALTEDLSRAGQDGEAEPPAETGGEPEIVPAVLLFAMLGRMFAAEARANGMDLRFVASARRFHAPAMALMRIASNLIANAIAHSGANRILVGVRPFGDELRLMVADNGNGFPDGDVDSALRSGVKGEESQGAGLGLSIVRELTAASGFTLDYRTGRNRGTVFAVSVPAID